MSQSHVHRIVGQIGEEALASDLGLTAFSIKAAKSADVFPARWYGPLKRLCDERGIPCPLAAFNFLDPDKKPVRRNVNATARVQGAVSDKGRAAR